MWLQRLPQVAHGQHRPRSPSAGHCEHCYHPSEICFWPGPTAALSNLSYTDVTSTELAAGSAAYFLEEQTERRGSLRREWSDFLGRRLPVYDRCQPIWRSEEEYAEEQHVQRPRAEARVANGDSQGNSGW